MNLKKRINHFNFIIGTVIAILGFLFYQSFAFALAAKTVYGDCNSSDKSKWFTSKTYMDVGGSGKYDYVTIKWCDGKITTKPLSIIGNLPHDIGISIHELTNYLVNPTNGLLSFTFNLREYSNGPIYAIETKYENNDTVFIQSLLFNNYQKNINDNKEIDQLITKEQLHCTYSEQSNLLLIEIFSENQLNSKITLTNNFNSSLLKTYEVELKNGWNIVSIQIKKEEYIQFNNIQCLINNKINLSASINNNYHSK